MYCSKCGGVMADGAAFCSNCGQAFGVAAAVARAPMMSSSVAAPLVGGMAAVPAYAGYAAVPRVEYAGFWLRFLAFLIDNAVMGIGFVLILIPLIFLTGLGGFISEIHDSQPALDVAVPRADGELGVAGYARKKGAWSGGDGHGRTARQLRPCDREALCQDHHQHGACVYRIHHGGIYRKKAGAARHDRGMPGAAAKQLKKKCEAQIRSKTSFGIRNDWRKKQT